MNKQIDFTQIGGFPLEENTLDFMQQSYTQGLAALANLCGDKVILSGVVVASGNISSGWISVGGEVIPFVGGPVAANVVINTLSVDATFENTLVYPVYNTKTASAAAIGNFPFTDLVRIETLANHWLPGDLKQKYVDATYEAANFDNNGYGLNREKGWRILSKAVPAAAGKVLVNKDAADVGINPFNVVGNTGGAKKTNITKGQLPAVNILGNASQTDVPAGTGGMLKRSAGNALDTAMLGDAEAAGAREPNIQVIYPFPNLGTGDDLNLMNPYFVVLTLIKL